MAPKRHERAICAYAPCNVPVKLAGEKYCSEDHYHLAQVGAARPELHRRKLVKCSVCGREEEVGGRTGKTLAWTHHRKCQGNLQWTSGPHAQILNPADAAYLAGLLDGEGSIYMFKRKNNNVALRLAVIMTTPAFQVIHELQGKLAVGNIVKSAPTNKRHSMRELWLINSEAAVSVLKQALPYLRIKKPQADLALEYWSKHEDLTKPQRLEYLYRMRAMNMRGPGSKVSFPEDDDPVT